MIASLRLQHFRSFSDGAFEFEPGVNIIVGPNASGKTNLLESILMIGTGKSYRGSDVETIQHNKSWARIDVVTVANIDHLLKLEKTGEKANKTFIIDGADYRRLPSHQKMPCVVFEPNQLQYIATSPDLRRGLIDSLAEQLLPGFGKLRRDYARTLQQRNALLKTPGAKQKLFAWNIRLSELGGRIVELRLKVLNMLNKTVGSTYSQLAGKKHEIVLQYESQLKTENYAADLLKKLEKTVVQDLERGFTSSGPHRDDIDIKINGSTIRGYASRGEVRTVLLAIKVQEALLLEEQTNQKALMLLDDVFGELDGQRRKALTAFLQTHQAFITTTDADIIAQKLQKSSRLIALG